MTNKKKISLTFLTLSVFALALIAMPVVQEEGMTSNSGITQIPTEQLALKQVRSEEKMEHDVYLYVTNTKGEKVPISGKPLVVEYLDPKDKEQVIYSEEVTTNIVGSVNLTKPEFIGAGSVRVKKPENTQAEYSLFISGSKSELEEIRAKFPDKSLAIKDTIALTPEAKKVQAEVKTEALSQESFNPIKIIELPRGSVINEGNDNKLELSANSTTSVTDEDMPKGQEVPVLVNGWGVGDECDICRDECEEGDQLKYTCRMYEDGRCSGGQWEVCPCDGRKNPCGACPSDCKDRCAEEPYQEINYCYENCVRCDPESPTPTPSGSPVSTELPLPTVTATPMVSSGLSSSTPTPVSSFTVTPTPEPSITSTFAASITPTGTGTRTPSPSPSASSSVRPSVTPTPSPGGGGTCSEPKIYSSVNRRCVCPAPLIEDSRGVCIACSAPKEWVYGIANSLDGRPRCMCAAPLVDDGVGGCKPCSGDKEYKDMGGGDRRCVCPYPLVQDHVVNIPPVIMGGTIFEIVKGSDRCVECGNGWVPPTDPNNSYSNLRFTIKHDQYHLQNIEIGNDYPDIMCTQYIHLNSSCPEKKGNLGLATTLCFCQPPFVSDGYQGCQHCPIGYYYSPYIGHLEQMTESISNCIPIPGSSPLPICKECEVQRDKSAENCMGDEYTAKRIGSMLGISVNTCTYAPPKCESGV